MSLDIDSITINAKRAANDFLSFTQEQVDNIVRNVYEAAFNQRVRLAKMACDETGIGKWEDKTTKNVIATRYVYEDIKNLKTVLRAESGTIPAVI